MGTARSTASRARWADGLAAVSILVFALVVAWLGGQRVVGTYGKETDFYHLYAPDADRLLLGGVPRHTNNTGPAYPVLLAALHPWTGDHFASGKAISLAAGVASAWTAYALFRMLFGRVVAVAGLAFVLTSADFVRFSLQATTDMAFLALALPAMLVATSGAAPAGRRALLAGVLSGLAYLVRYVGVFLGPACLYALIRQEPAGRRARWRAVALYLAGVLAVVSPWLVANQWIHGTPLYHRAHLMLAVLVHGLPRDLDGLRDAALRFDSVGEVIGLDPLGFAVRYLRNVVTTLANSLGAPLAVLPLGVLAVAGGLAVARRGETTRARPLVASVLFYLAVVALVHWESRYFLYGYVVYAGLAAHAVGLAAARARPSRGRSVALFVVLAAAVLVPALVRTPRRTAELMRDQPLALLDAAKALRGAPGGVTPRIMGRKPHLAYLAGGEWIFLPRTESLGGLRAALCQAAADYVVYDDAARKLRPALTALGDPRAAVPWLRPVHVDLGAPLIVYAVALGDACGE